jgi:hypothetical protein
MAFELRLVGDEMAELRFPNAPVRIKPIQLFNSPASRVWFPPPRGQQPSRGGSPVS